MRTKAPPFSGVCTALATPFKDGEIDYETLKELIEYQISQKVDALLVCGTTGEASALSAKERKELVWRTAVQVCGRVPLLVGTGTNVTMQTVAWSLHAASCGTDALLVVTPYYNKGTQEGIVSHYLEVADRVDLPQIVYHVPSRTGVRLSFAQLEQIFAHPNVVAIKEADADMDRMIDEIAAFGDKISFYT
ncbi:MAG: dihydrodipicolinate synthase family protein, partial [Clostridia bacterium]|nr:dihydrodipicolinate synthase family protein [Clostridia bacterium]